MSDYAHCKVCDKVINLDTDTWYTDGNDTYCIEDNISELERIIYDYVREHYGVSEADNPSWAIKPLADHITNEMCRYAPEKEKK